MSENANDDSDARFFLYLGIGMGVLAFGIFAGMALVFWAIGSA